MPRLVDVVLANPAHRMPHPMNPQIDFPADGQRIDEEDPVWMQLLADGSIVERRKTEPRGRKRKETT